MCERRQRSGVIVLAVSADAGAPGIPGPAPSSVSASCRRSFNHVYVRASVVNRSSFKLSEPGLQGKGLHLPDLYMAGVHVVDR